MLADGFSTPMTLKQTLEIFALLPFLVAALSYDIRVEEFPNIARQGEAINLKQFAGQE